MLVTRDIPGVEILSVGSWHGTNCPTSGCAFTTEDLDRIVADYEATKASTFTAPLKLGHTEDQKLLQSDGLPAAGWLANLRRDGEKLLADLMKVPGKIADLIDVGAYRNRSLELEGDRVVGMALLGADLPAVENLDDITGLYKRARLSLKAETKAVLFTASPNVSFALPSGMSYDDLSQALRVAFCEASPGADPEDVWVSDLYDNSAIFCLDGRYWQQSYTVAKSGVSVTGTPSEVQRVTQWQPVAMKRAFVQGGEAAIAALAAFTTRAKSRAEFRAAEGRSLSKDNRELLARLAESAEAARTELETLSRDAGEPAIDQDYKSAMRARLMEAQTSMAALVGG